MKPELREIIQILVEKSKKNQVAWRPAADILGDWGEDWDYAVNTPQNTFNVFLSQISEEREAEAIRFNILDSKGTVIITQAYKQGEPDYALVKELLHSARDTVLGVDLDATLKSLREALNNDSVIGEDSDS